MDFKKFIVIPIGIGFLACTFVAIDQFISPYLPIAGNKGFGWVTFQAWAISLIDFVPALFVSSAVFFAFTQLYPAATFTNDALIILLYCVIGMIYGVVTVELRGLYEKMVTAKK